MTMLDQARARTLFSRRNVVVAAVALAVLVTVGLVWFQPQKLFIDKAVNEAAPTQSLNDAMSDGTNDLMKGSSKDAMHDDAMMKSASLAGTFSSLAHDTKGRATVKTLDDGSRVLRLEDFETSNGPDVVVYLSTGEPYGKHFVDLGSLKGNVGNQNYEIPSGTDLDRYDTVVIWCRRFTVAFGAAKLTT